MNSNGSSLPLAGVRVLEITTAWAGPRVTRILGHMGAEVIKIENPARPDNARRDPPFAGGVPGINNSGCFDIFNRDKKDVALDLKSAEGVAIVKRLVKVSDILVQNFAPRVMDNLGLSYPILKEINPGLVMLSLSGYGATGPDRDRVAFGAVLEAYSGLDKLSGYGDGMPGQCGTVISDYATGNVGIFAVLAALHYKKRTGQGQHIDLSEVENLLACIPEAVMEYTMNGRVPPARGNKDEVMVPHGCYRCRGEDFWIAIAVSSESEWQGLCRVMGEPELANDERFCDAFCRHRHEAELDAIISRWTRDKEHLALMHELQQAGVAAGPAYSQEELYNDTHIEQRGFLVETEHPVMGKRLLPGVFAKLSKTPGAVRTPSPLLGEHNEWLFNELLPKIKD
ncbi:MAG: CoA transferase [Dehalococcoidales bacterium]|nr:CoA transferase [Dehalococcoidales bacterium]